MPIGVRPAAKRDATPVTRVERCGVWNRGWMRPAHGGSRPSFAIDMKMRGCASIMTTMTELRPAMAPTVDQHLHGGHGPAHDVPAARPAAASIATTSGAGWFSIAWYGTRPTITPETST